MKETDWQLFLQLVFPFIVGFSVYGINKRVTFLTYFRQEFFFIASVKLLQTLRLLQSLLFYYFYSNVFPQTQRKN